jgi:nitrogen fixation-related uncharacterized protein
MAVLFVVAIAAAVLLAALAYGLLLWAMDDDQGAAARPPRGWPQG